MAKGRFSQPRQPRWDDEDFQAYQPPAEPQAPETPAPQVPEHDSTLDETMVVPEGFVPGQVPPQPQPPQSQPVSMEETMTFDEAMFHQETAAAPVVHYAEEEEEYDEEPVYARQDGPSGQNKTRKILLVSICAVTALLLIAIIAGVVMYVNANADDGLILNNVTIAGINVGGMTPEEAAEAVHRATDLTYTSENMVINLPDTILELSPQDTGAKLDVEAAVEAAYNYGRSGTAEENKKARADSLTSNHTIALLPYLDLDLDYIRQVLEEYGEYFNSDFTQSSWELEGEKPKLDAEHFDEKAACQTLVLTPGTPGRYVDVDKVYNDVIDAYSLNKFVVDTNMTDEEVTPDALDLEAIFEEICSEAVNAAMDTETFDVTPEVYGYTFDLEKAQDLLSQTEYGGTVGIPLEYVIPEVLSADLEGKLFRDELAYYETKHTNDSNRNHNLELACKAINEYILMPGDTFDYNKVLGERTEAAGYKPAGALSAGTSTTEIGGGICQVSSTLYYCTLLSDLEIVSRRSHSLVSSYIPMGMDATVSWGGPEFKFKNNTNYPIRIEAEVSGGYVKVRLMGTDEKDYYVKMEYKVVEVLDPTTTYKEYASAADAKADGYTNGQVIQQPVTGYTVYTYKCKYDKETDEMISRDYEATSNYVKKDKIVVKVLEAETEPPATTETPVTEAPTTETTTPPATDPPADSGGESPASDESGTEG